MRTLTILAAALLAAAGVLYDFKPGDFSFSSNETDGLDPAAWSVQVRTAIHDGAFNTVEVSPGGCMLMRSAILLLPDCAARAGARATCSRRRRRTLARAGRRGSRSARGRSSSGPAR